MKEHILFNGTLYPLEDYVTKEELDIIRTVSGSKALFENNCSLLVDLLKVGVVKTKPRISLSLRKIREYIIDNDFPENFPTEALYVFILQALFNHFYLKNTDYENSSKQV